ncbi:MAG: AtpZ/AtpI family protein [Eubacteriales bacterium]|nr:AtpZ/AtpI family protein [Eubacteriales bacterium]
MKKNSGLEYFALITQVGFMMLTPIILCLLLGLWLDKKFETGGIFAIVFLVLGMLAAFRVILRLDKFRFAKNRKADPDAKLRAKMEAVLKERKDADTRAKEQAARSADEVEEW